jgi:hypothetical protein
VTTLTEIPTITDAMMRTARIVIAEHVADHYLDGSIGDDGLNERLAALSPLPAEQARAAFADLCGELEWRRKVDARDYDTATCAPGEDYAAVWDDACRRVEGAIDVLVGGAR